jgi:hypothetical protein
VGGEAVFDPLSNVTTTYPYATNSSGSVDRPGITYAYDADSLYIGTSSPSFQVTGRITSTRELVHGATHT